MALEMNLEVSHISEALRGFWFLSGFWKSGSEQEEKKESRRFLKEWQRTFQAIFSYPRACFEHTLLKKNHQPVQVKGGSLEDPLRCGPLLSPGLFMLVLSACCVSK